MNIPQALGYTRIAGMPVVTGLYTLLLPLVAFAALGSSRYLVVAADSATAAILAGGLSPLAPVGERALRRARRPRGAADGRLSAAGAALPARLPRRLPFADRAGRLPHRRRLPGRHRRARRDARPAGRLQPHGRPARAGRARFAARASADARGLRGGRGDGPRLPRLAPRLPGPLFAVVGAIAASAAFDFSGHGIAVIGPVAGGLPRIGLPDVTWGEIPRLLPVAASCFLMIVAQSAATARAYAARHRQTLDENADLVGLSAANAAAALSGTFVVNGSPTQTAMVERSGGRSQLAHLATAAVVAIVLLFLTGPLQYLPRCVLGAIVFTIAVGLVDVRGLRDIRRESPGEFRLALATAAAVVADRRRAGHPAGDGAVAAPPRAPQLSAAHGGAGGGRRALAADPGRPGRAERAGLVIYRFGADLFYANAGHFAADVRGLVAEHPRPCAGWWSTPARSPASTTRPRGCCGSCNRT